jgi:DNA-binding helix-hairpin-helix protein with protein kinase domain
LRSEAEELARRVNNLLVEETTKISELKNKQREIQLKLFLEKYYISNAHIKGIGSARKATLRSYGIETAADVSRHRVQSISGFGWKTISALLAWVAGVNPDASSQCGHTSTRVKLSCAPDGSIFANGRCAIIRVSAVHD